MEVELEINITPTNLPPITKDPVFLSTETDTLIILIANLKGYQKEKLKIDRNEDGTQIAVSGEKVGSTSLQPLRWIAFRATPQVTKFRKVFWIPDGVVLDQIKARFNEKESVLWIFMPKSVTEVSGVGVEEVKEEEIGRRSHRRTRPVPDKVPEREIPGKNEEEMKEGMKDVPKHEPEEVKESIPMAEVAERENPRKSEQEMKEGKKDVKATEVVGGLPQHDPEREKEAIPQKEAAERENPRKNEQEMKEERKDAKATDEDVGRLHRHEPEQVKEPISQKEADERENPRKNEQEMEEGREEVKATDEDVGRPQHEPEQVKEAMLKKEAADITITRPEEEHTRSNKREVPSNEETPAKEDSDLEAKSTAAEEKSEECQHDPEVTESKKVEAVQVTQRAHVEEDNAPEENGEVETHLSQQELNTEIQEVSQLESDQESDPTESLKPDHPEEVQEMGNEIQAEIDQVIPPEEKVDNRKGSLALPKKFRLCSPCFFAGSAILISIVVLVIHFSRRKRR
ncbi:hypothetical protein PVL29_024478 [Vitis rotundifolia]|uniref:SHSP domain-containing protein n=1 Tax=Vitis rotundifolia TaxID=103349 RepID=A0AA38YRY3_VITRO|nr:hypothetical protein PVL29_024478 [Vitis rotundifolia]